MRIASIVIRTPLKGEKIGRGGVSRRRLAVGGVKGATFKRENGRSRIGNAGQEEKNSRKRNSIVETARTKDGRLMG